MGLKSVDWASQSTVRTDNHENSDLLDTNGSGITSQNIKINSDSEVLPKLEASVSDNFSCHIEHTNNRYSFENKTNIVLNENNLINSCAVITNTEMNNYLENVSCKENCNPVDEKTDKASVSVEEKTKIDNESGKSNYHRSSLDMFDDSEESSSSDGNENEKFKDVICSLSLYQDKVSKISSTNEDSFSDDDLISPEKSVVDRHDYNDNKSLFFESKRNDNHNLDDNHEVKNNELINYDTQYENMFDSDCLKNWDSIIKKDKDMIECKNFNINKKTMDRINNENEKVKFESSDILARTPLTKTKSILGKLCNFSSYSIQSNNEIITINNKKTNLVTEKDVRMSANDLLSKSTRTALSINNVENCVKNTKTDSFLSQKLNANDVFVKNQELQQKDEIINDKCIFLNSDETIFNEFVMNTPINNFKIKNNHSIASSVDLFECSPNNNNCDKLDKAFSLNSLEDMDINCGGESIIENSMLLVDKKMGNWSPFNIINCKRKFHLTSDEENNCCKKMKLSQNFVDFVDNNPTNFNECLKSTNKNSNISKTDIDKKTFKTLCASKNMYLDKYSEILINSCDKIANGYLMNDTLRIDSQMCKVLDSSCSTINIHSKIKDEKDYMKTPSNNKIVRHGGDLRISEDVSDGNTEVPLQYKNELKNDSVFKKTCLTIISSKTESELDTMKMNLDFIPNKKSVHKNSSMALNEINARLSENNKELLNGTQENILLKNKSAPINVDVEKNNLDFYNYGNKPSGNFRKDMSAVNGISFNETSKYSDLNNTCSISKVKCDDFIASSQEDPQLTVKGVHTRLVFKTRS